MVVRDAESAAYFGISEDDQNYMCNLGMEQILALSETDALIFKFEDVVDSHPTHMIPEPARRLLEHLAIIGRDLARDDQGLAAAKMGLDKTRQEELLRSRMIDAKNVFINRPVKISPMGGTTPFRIMASLKNRSERTQYLALAANDV